jgi:endoglucanase
VAQYVQRFVAARPRLGLTRDRSGNLLIEIRRAAPGTRPTARWVFAAHMDHPGLIADKMADRQTLEAHFRGGVHTDYVRGATVRFFQSDGDGADEQVRGTIVKANGRNPGGRADVPDHVRVRVAKPVGPGSPGMFDQGEGRVRGQRFYSRVCDDLAGAAAALTMLDRLQRRLPQSPVAVLLTRAEEDGFIGAIAAAKDHRLLRRTDRLIVLETSAMQPYAPQGAGAIIRIGDKSSIFNSSLSYFLTDQAGQLARRDKSFRFQRALMPGGTCEATVYDIYGYMAASICVALGNYHNMDRQRKRIGPEYVDIEDWQNMVKLLVHLARTGHQYQPGHALLRQRIETRFARLRKLL